MLLHVFNASGVIERLPGWGVEERILLRRILKIMRDCASWIIFDSGCYGLLWIWHSNVTPNKRRVFAVDKRLWASQKGTFST